MSLLAMKLGRSFYQINLLPHTRVLLCNRSRRKVKERHPSQIDRGRQITIGMRTPDTSCT